MLQALPYPPDSLRGAVVESQLLLHTLAYRVFPGTSERLGHPKEELFKNNRTWTFSSNLISIEFSFSFPEQDGDGEEGQIGHQAPGRESKLLMDRERISSL